MTKNVTRILSTIFLLSALACGGQVKPTATPNDEVTVPLGTEDQAALENDASEEDSEDASESESPETTSTTP